MVSFIKESGVTLRASRLRRYEVPEDPIGQVSKLTWEEEATPRYTKIREVVEWGRKRDGGLTLVEVLVALGLIAVSLMMVLSMIPAGVRASQRAADVQDAAAWARQLIEETPSPNEFPIPADLAMSNHAQKIGATDFTAQRKVTVKGAYLYRVEVTVTWRAADVPVTIALTRYNPAGPES